MIGGRWPVVGGRWSVVGGRGKAIYFGSFERLGKLWLRATDHVRSIHGMPYRVTYSPVSKTVWSLEPLHPVRIKS